MTNGGGGVFDGVSKKPRGKMIPTPAKAKAILIRFEPLKLFPPGDALTTPLLRLMLATDDVRFASRLMIETGQRLPSVLKGIQDLILTGEFWYSLRLLCSHLNEAGDALRRLDTTVSRARVDGLLKGWPKAIEALKSLRAVFESDEREESFIYKVRNWIGFHYQDQDIKRVFEKCLSLGLIEGAVTASEVSGLARFTITDGLAMFLMIEASGVDIAGLTAESATREIERFAKLSSDEVLPVSDALTAFVDQFVSTLLEKRGHIGFEEGVIDIPSLVRSARDAVEAERQSGLDGQTPDAVGPGAEAANRGFE